uniref:C-type lectin domain-containing protein n=1 Tax=Maylandia zebra TaxID=106582 RepID=A0A3P9BG54_9CICH
MFASSSDECYVLKKSSSCPCDWTEYNNKCYFYVSTPLPWGDAQRNCQTMSANLASVRSLGEYQLIQRVISDGGRANVEHGLVVLMVNRYASLPVKT